MRNRPLGLLLALSLVSWAACPASDVRAGDDGVAAEVEVLSKNATDPFEQDKRAAAVRRLGALGGPEAAAALLPLFDDPFEHLADHAVSAWIAMLKGGRAPETQTWLVKSALPHRSPAVRAGAALALGISGGSELSDVWGPALSKETEPSVLLALARGSASSREAPLAPAAFVPLLAHADGRVVLAAAEVAYGAPDAAEAPLRKALGHRDPLARAGAVLGLARACRLLEAEVARVLSDKSHEPKIALLERLAAGLALLPIPGAGEDVLRTLLGDPSWRVRAAAIETSVLLWNRRAVPGLIDRLEVETGRLAHSTLDALRTLTGIEHPGDAEVWRRWWSAHAEDFDLGPRPAVDRFGRVRRNAALQAGEVPRAGDTQTMQFFDLPVRSQRLAFLFDLSGSMSKSSVGDAGPSKLDLVRTEFGRLLSSLPDGTALDVLVYRYPSTFPPKATLTRALGKVSPLAAGSRKRVVEWLAQQPAKGWGAFYEALLHAAAEDVDTVVLLSDGVPSRGRYERPARLLDEWLRANRFRRVAVDTVLVGAKGIDREFMDDLAWASCGHSAQSRAGR